jgi:hypothetical protein
MSLHNGELWLFDRKTVFAPHTSIMEGAVCDRSLARDYERAEQKHCENPLNKEEAMILSTDLVTY